MEPTIKACYSQGYSISVVCLKGVGKKWGLRPKIIHWIFTAIIRPKISYASLVWWTKTVQATARKKLAKLQRIATLAITGAMRSTSNEALNALLNILPLHQFIELEAERSALRLSKHKTLYEGDLTGHLKILKIFKINSLIVKNDDWMEPVFNLDIPYNVTINDRDVWESGGPAVPSGSIKFFTDGSKMDKRTGAGVFGPRLRISIPMGNWPTVFQAEVQAILECTLACLKRGYRYTSIYIFSDSQAALRALSTFTCYSKLVWECIVALRNLAIRNRVFLFWVPGHCGILGNEEADQLAREGSQGLFIGPEPFCGVSRSALNMELKNWESTTIVSNWRTAEGAAQAKRFIEPSARLSKNMLKLSKHELSTYTGLLTGHCPSKQHLKRITLFNTMTVGSAGSKKKLQSIFYATAAPS
ncbi:uncharacterized protein LOC129738667 [Uranotaenia lowii]|uniref:uncharacterized protein LOC129738667 n=1 Tax=Uranotaenia lowii TaxID=190385 RepID=UPI0024791639|nr:uncharacterized protein LOC129738667 [Uranotaenia lowii]XP_055585906.1 uncharacterized protein LOC129738667 [Uranotaenia lowii]